jgi:gliding motility-associated-like protein
MDDVFFGEYVYIQDTVTVAVPKPTAPVVNNISVCQNSTAPSLASQVTGTGLMWYNAATGGTGTGTTPNFTTATIGNTNYWVAQSISGCVGPRTQLTAQVKALPASPTVVNPADRCENSTAPVLSNAVTGTGLQWYTLATGGTGSAIAPTASTSSAGTFNHWVSQTVNGCEGPRAALTYKINATPNAPLVSNLSAVCKNTTAPNLALSVTGSSLKWYAVATGGIGVSTAPTASSSTVGTFDYWVSQTITGCESNRSKVSYTITDLPSAPVVNAPSAVCLNATAPNLASSVTGTGLKWYTVATGGTFSNVAPTASSNAVGVFDYWVSQDNGCEGPRSKVSYEVKALPAAPLTTNPADICQFSSPADLNLHVTGSNLTWYTLNVGGIGTNATPVINASSSGSFDYFVSQTINGCESARSQLNYKILASPVEPTVVITPSSTTCLGGTIPTITATSSGTLTWYNLPLGGGGTLVTPVVDGTIVGQQTFWVTNSNGICESKRVQVQVIIYPNPTMTAVSPSMICKGDELIVSLQFDGSAPFQLTYLYTGVQKQLTTAKIEDELTLIPNADGTIIFERLSDLYCITQFNNYAQNYIVNQLPDLTLSTNATICSQQLNSVFMNSSIPNVYYKWSYFVSNNNLKVGLNTSTDTEIKHVLTNEDNVPLTIEYEVTAINSGCIGQTKKTTVVVMPDYVPQLAELQPVCVGTSVNLNAGDAPVGFQFEWYKNAELIDNEQNSSITIKVTEDNEVYKVVVKNSCNQYQEVSTIATLLDRQHFKDLVVTDSCTVDATSFELNSTGLLDVTKWTIVQSEQLVEVNNGISKYKQRFPIVNDYNIKVEGYRNGCLLADTAFVFKGKDCSIKIVNTFTPNNDGANDFWHIEGIEYQPLASIEIFNRWGQIIKAYASNIPIEVWDGTNAAGTAMENGTYYYILDLKNKTKPIKGYVTILKE